MQHESYPDHARSHRAPRFLSVGVCALVAAACSSVPYAPAGRDGGVRDASPLPLLDGEVPDGARDGGGGGTSTFDPDAVYLIGTLSEGACYLDAIEDFDPATGALAGLPCTTRDHVIRPSDGRLLYLLSEGGDDSIRVFTADPWRRKRGGTFDYPDIPEANDARIPTPECASIHSFDVEPGTGDVLYRCRECAPGVDCAGRLYRVGGSEYPVPPETERMWLGRDGTSLVERSPGAGIQQRLSIWRDGAQGPRVETDLADFAMYPTDILSVRAEAEGFVVLTQEGARYTLFSVAASDGAVTLLGDYPLVGDELSDPRGCVLDAARRLYCQSHRLTGASEDVVFRFELESESGEIIHDEADEPDVLIHISDLITGV